jgi:hypothetical protein
VLPAWGRKEKAETKTTGTQQIVLGKNAVEEIEEEETEAVETFVQVTGIVRLVGGGPIPELVITGQDKEWYVSREEDHLLKELQHRTVTVEGYETVIELRFANGLPAGRRRTLRDIKILAVE